MRALQSRQAENPRAGADRQRAASPSAAARPLSIHGACPCGGSCPRCTGSGAPLAQPLRSAFEQRLGTSLGDVRVHVDAAAAQAAADAGAHAITVGNHIRFGTGMYAPGSTEGSVRLAHELVHVVQQRRGAAGAAPTGTKRAEREARELGAAVAAGRHVAVRGAAAPNTMQCDGPASDETADPSTAPAPDQDAEDWILRHFIRWWVGNWLVAGDAPTALPAPAAPDLTPATQLGTFVPPAVSLLPALTLRPDLFAPLPPDPTFIEPDVGALFAPFAERGAPVGAGDDAAVRSIYRGNARIAAGLPDLRAMAPRVVRPLIPTTWRRDIAGALTAAAVGNALKRDYPTPIEVADRAWENMTGASTTVIPLPSISFDLP